MTDQKDHNASKLDAFYKLSLVSSDIFLVLSPKGEIEFANRSFQKVLGYNSEQTLGANILEFISTSDINQASESDLESQLFGRTILSDWRGRIQARNGETIWFSITAVFIEEKWFVIARDINELIDFDENLIQERERFKFFTESSYEGIALEIDGKIADCNQMYLKVFEAEAKDIINQDSNKFLELDESIDWDQIFNDEKVTSYEAQAITSKGNRINLEVNKRPAFHKGQKGKLVAVRDITKRKVLENELKDKDILHSSIAENEHILFATIDEKGKVQDISKGALLLLNSSKEDAFGKHLLSLISLQEGIKDPENKLQEINGVKQFLLNDNQEQFEQEISFKSQQQIKTIQLKISRLGGGASGQLIVFKDVTDLKENILKLQLTEEELRNTIKSAKLASWHYDFENWVLELSPETKNILDLDNLQLPFEEFIKSIHPEDVEDTVVHLQKSLEGKEFSCDTRIVLNGKTNYIHLQGFNSSITVSGNQKPVIKGYFQDITKRKQEELELKEAKIKAEQHTRAKNLFLASMSHEIRTPLNSILGFAQILESKIEQPDAKKLLGSIKNSGDTLLKLINDILDLSKIESSKIELHKEEFTLNKLIEYQKSLFKNIARDKSIKFQISSEISPTKIFKADFYRINQVLMNLINNAIKFTRKGSVTLYIDYQSDDENRLHFKVVDTGIGVEESALENIFKTFEQANSEITKNFGGTGLGLAIVKGLVELMNGSIEVSSVLNQGTTFDVYIEVEKMGHTDPEELIIKKQEDRTVSISRKVKILLAEDNPTNQLLMQEVFAQLNIEYEIAGDGTIALDILKRSKGFDLGIFDIQMPNMDGNMAVKIIRSNKELYPQFPIIALTADATTQEKNIALSNGFDGFLSKPFKIVDLVKKINELLGLKNEEPKKDIKQSEKNSINLDWSWKLDFTYLEDVTQNKTDAIVKILGQCCNTLPTKISDLDVAAKEGDVKKVGDIAHAIKGQITLFISKEDQELVGRYYQKIRNLDRINNSNRNLIDTLVAELKHLTNLLNGQLKNYEEKISHH